MKTVEYLWSAEWESVCVEVKVRCTQRSSLFTVTYDNVIDVLVNRAVRFHRELLKQEAQVGPEEPMLFQLETGMSCPDCSADARPPAKFCGKCGSRIEPRSLPCSLQFENGWFNVRCRLAINGRVVIDEWK